MCEEYVFAKTSFVAGNSSIYRNAGELRIFRNILIAENETVECRCSGNDRQSKFSGNFVTKSRSTDLWNTQATSGDHQGIRAKLTTCGANRKAVGFLN